jgi:hypothetical protein
MIGHDNERIQTQVGELPWQIEPRFADDLPQVPILK